MKKAFLISVLAVLSLGACKPAQHDGLCVMSFNVRNSAADDGAIPTSILV